MRVNKMNQPNGGIKCVVDTCYYYTKGDHCTAEKIEVAPKNASSSNETDCETFIPGK
jgi:Domain of Unknown Function (DUF1540).